MKLITIKNIQDLRELITTYRQSPAKWDFVVGEDGNTYMTEKDEIIDRSVEPFRKLYTNYALKGFLDSKAFCDVIISGKAPTKEQQKAIMPLFIYPITYDINLLPVINPTGHSYDLLSMIKLCHLSENGYTADPLSPERTFTERELIPNSVLQDITSVYATIDPDFAKTAGDSIKKIKESVEEVQQRISNGELQQLINGDRRSVKVHHTVAVASVITMLAAFLTQIALIIEMGAKGEKTFEKLWEQVLCASSLGLEVAAGCVLLAGLLKANKYRHSLIETISVLNVLEAQQLLLSKINSTLKSYSFDATTTAAVVVNIGDPDAADTASATVTKAAALPLPPSRAPAGDAEKVANLRNIFRHCQTNGGGATVALQIQDAPTAGPQ